MVSAQLASDLPAVWADRVELQQVLLNLIINVRSNGGDGGGRAQTADGGRLGFFVDWAGAFASKPAPTLGFAVFENTVADAKPVGAGLLAKEHPRDSQHLVDAYRPLQLASSVPKI
ncbi:hypothetical protein [Pseudomonas sp. Irchel s3a10]|uniref:hypothetical protein n=1 Tax=Pseudomonas sp. Irchel s3a10 TaxID=2009045 RepID=UPI000BA30056|nr:hypothetical protein [Pseudomonas sp. Irchel s3a10]